MGKNCSSCGKINLMQANYCEKCGKELKEQSSILPYLIGSGSALIILIILYTILVKIL